MTKLPRLLRGLGPSLIAICAIGAVSVSSNPAEAQPFACSAAADVLPTLCKSGGCNPAALANGEAVPLTIELGNDSLYNSFGALTDPPKADTIAFTMRVYYSCTDNSCATVNAGDFTHDSDSCTAGCSFADSGGSGYGTITCNAGALSFPAGDTTKQELCTVNLTANSPPGTGVISVLAGFPADDSSNNLLELDEPVNCIGTPVGGGQGSTAAQFASAPPPGDLDSCDHPNKQIIKLGGSQDLGKGRLSFPDDCDPASESFDIGYDNLTGGAFSFGSIPAGGIQKSGRCWVYKDKSAKSSGGISSLRICPVKSKPGQLCVNYKGYGDIAPILVSDDMSIVVNACGGTYEGPPNPIWNEGSKKWILPRSAWVP